MVMPGPFFGDLPVNHRGKTSRYHGNPHIDVNDEPADGGKRRDGVNDNGHRAHGPELPGNRVDKPEHEPGSEQRSSTKEHQPEEQLLPVVETPSPRHVHVLVPDVVT